MMSAPSAAGALYDVSRISISSVRIWIMSAKYLLAAEALDDVCRMCVSSLSWEPADPDDVDMQNVCWLQEHLLVPAESLLVAGALDDVGRLLAAETLDDVGRMSVSSRSNRLSWQNVCWQPEHWTMSAECLFSAGTLDDVGIMSVSSRNMG